MSDETLFYAELLRGYPVIVVQPVVWGEMDAYQHVNNVVYFRYFENARLEYVQRLRWPDYEQATGIGPILAATQARFVRPLTYPDTIAIGTRLDSMGDDRFHIEHRIVSRRLGKVVTEGQGTVVTYNYRESRKVALPEELKERIRALEATATEKLA
jgi:acyl-CoA thioester hydrolase